MPDIPSIVKYAYEHHGMQQIQEEITWLLDILSRRKVVVGMEIGAAGGGTSYCFSHVSTVFYSIDQNVITTPAPGVAYIHADSHDPKTIHLLPDETRLDFLFIDGDHSYEGAKLDYEMYSKLVRPGGLIALHDIVESDYHEQHGCEVWKLWHELKQKHFTREVGQYNWGGIGVLCVC